jgi:hypothetical protein
VKEERGTRASAGGRTDEHARGECVCGDDMAGRGLGALSVRAAPEHAVRRIDMADQ